MAIKTISIGNQEDIYQYDDTETYSDSSTVQGIKAATIQVTGAPSDTNDVLRLGDMGGGGSASFGEYWQSPVIDKDLTTPPI